MHSYPSEFPYRTLPWCPQDLKRRLGNELLFFGIAQQGKGKQSQERRYEKPGLLQIRRIKGDLSLEVTKTHSIHPDCFGVCPGALWVIRIV